MIRMSLDKDAILPLEVPIKVSPAFPPTVSLSEPLPLTKSRPFCTKNVLQSCGNTTMLSQQMGKRRYSVGVGFKGLAKRRRRANSDSQSDHILPSHFLLGGNIFDPLNLNSLLDEDVNRATNQETPKCSPLPTRGGDPVEILVPRDITDPLNLKGGEEGGAEGGRRLLSPLKRRRHRNRHHGGGGAGDTDKETVPARLFPAVTVPLLTTEGSVPVSPLPCELNTAITCRDDVAPPPILPRRHTHPPPGHASKPCHQRRRRRTTSARSADGANTNTHRVTIATAPQPTKFQTPLMGGAKDSRCGGAELVLNRTPQKKRKDKHRYQCGNHSRYYGYQGFYGDQREGRVGVEDDSRLQLLEADWFRDRKVLDVGCGAGHMTLAVARRFNPAHILGVELDRQLVHAANQNIRHFMSHDLVVKERRRGQALLPSATSAHRATAAVNKDEGEVETLDFEDMMEDFHQTLSLLSFPTSFRVTRGPLTAPPLLLSAPLPSARFPDNITFVQGNYVSEQEAWPGRGQYDVIMCLGVTKWVQLQSGDGGVIRLFKRAYQSLSLGGLFILEPQPWSSYGRSKRASETTYRNYRNLRLKPEQFTCFLTDGVGFTSYRLLTHTGNQRPIYLFHKGHTHRK